MDIAKIQDALECLAVVQRDYQNQFGELLRRRDSLPPEEYDALVEELHMLLEMTEETIAEHEQSLIDAAKTAKRLSRRQKGDIWHKITFSCRQRFPYYPFKLTPADYVVLRALGELAKGSKAVIVAIDYIAKKYHVSRSQVKLSLKKLKSLALISVQVRRKKGHRDNLPNRYYFACDKLREWARRCFLKGGSENQPHSLSANRPIATEEVKRQTPTHDAAEGNQCRQKARRSISAEAPEALNDTTYLAVGLGALDVLGVRLDEQTTPDDLDSVIDELWDELQPGFNPYFRKMGETRHGSRRTRLAFLTTRMVKDMRLAPIPDKRPQNERETVKNVNGYLWGILNRQPGQARPEITLGKVLKTKEIYTLPYSLLRDIQNHKPAIWA